MSKPFKSKPSEKGLYAIRAAVEKLLTKLEGTNTKGGKRMWKALNKCSNKLSEINIGNDADN